MVLESQHQHGDGIEGETPDHAEGVRLTQGIYIAPAGDDGHHLQADDQVNQAVTGAVLAVRPPEPVGEYTVFGYTVQNAVGTDDGSVDGAGENQETYNHHEDAKN